MTPYEPTALSDKRKELEALYDTVRRRCGLNNNELMFLSNRRALLGRVGKERGSLLTEGTWREVAAFLNGILYANDLYDGRSGR